jgi:hypothetical protein
MFAKAVEKRAGMAAESSRTGICIEKLGGVGQPVEARFVKGISASRENLVSFIVEELEQPSSP